MIFAHTLDKILCGEKWQTRRLVKPNESLHLSPSTRVEAFGKRTIYQVGKTYAVQPNRGKKAVARILLTGLRKESVEAISESDALAEGFASPDEFIKTWRTIHGKNTDLGREVWVLEFRLDTIVSDEFKVLYEHYISKNRSIDHRHDLPATVTRLPGVSLHSGSYKIG